MASTTYTDYTTPAVNAAWLNDVNDRVYDDVINVKNYGAVGDGITNDTAAIQAALDAAGSTTEVIFPKGTYLCSASLKLTNASGKDFQGRITGQKAIINFSNAGNSTDADSAMQHGFEAYPVTNGSGGDITGMRNVQIKGLEINGPAHGASIYLANSQDTTIQDCKLKTNRYGIATECCINTKIQNNVIQDYTNAGVGLIMSGDTARVWYGSGTPATSYWNDSPLIQGNGFGQSALTSPLAHILDMGSQSESVRLIQNNYFYSNISGGSFLGAQYGYVSRNANPVLIGNWFENVKYPIRTLNSNAAEGGGNLTGVAGAEPSGTYALSNFVDGFSYAATVQGNQFFGSLISINLSGTTGGSSFVGGNQAGLIQNGGTHLFSNQTGSSHIVDAGDTVFSPIGSYTYKNITGQYTNLKAEWTDWVPTVTSTAGTLTTVTTEAAKYMQRGKEVHFRISILITTNGTGATSINITLPVTVTAGAGNNQGSVIPGRETVNTGHMLQGRCLGTNCVVTKYDSSYPGGNGARLVLSGTVQVD